MLRKYQSRLRSEGIWSYCDDDEIALVCGIEAPNSTSELFVERFGRSVCVGVYEEFKTRLIDPFHILSVEGGFSFHNRPAEVFGVENLDQISGFKDDIEDVIVLCEKYLLVPQVDILGWPVPLHQHPDWELCAVTSAIRYAKQIKRHQMIEMVIKGREAANRLLASGRKHSAETFARCFFYPICADGRDPRSKNQSDTLPKLFLRSDCSEAFIVQ